jgi:hypothetical protein
MKTLRFLFLQFRNNFIIYDADRSERMLFAYGLPEMASFTEYKPESYSSSESSVLL